MQRLELAAGGVTAMEIANGDRRPRPLFLGYPVNFTQVMPRTEANSQVCALLGDLSMGSVMGDRRQRTLFTDPYSLANYDQIQVRGTERVDINIHDVGNASATAGLRQPGPIVGLITAAS
jgi:HK97 family phage major capsid protein